MVTTLVSLPFKTLKMYRHKKSRAPLPYQTINRLKRAIIRWRVIAYLDHNNRLQSKRTNNEFVS